LACRNIYGRNEASVFYGFGYANRPEPRRHRAQTLWRGARGAPAEYWGASEVESDKWVLANDVYARAGRWYRQEPPGVPRRPSTPSPPGSTPTPRRTPTA